MVESWAIGEKEVDKDWGSLYICLLVMIDIRFLDRYQEAWMVIILSSCYHAFNVRRLAPPIMGPGEVCVPAFMTP